MKCFVASQFFFAVESSFKTAAAEAPPGVSSLTVSQACEADWRHLKTGITKSVHRLEPGKSLDAVMASVEARHRTSHAEPALILQDFSSRLVNGSAVFSHYDLSKKVHVPAASHFFSSCPKNVRVFDLKEYPKSDLHDLHEDLEMVYVMPVGCSVMEMPQKMAQLMFSLLQRADSPQEAACCSQDNFFLVLPMGIEYVYIYIDISLSWAHIFSAGIFYWFSLASMQVKSALEMSGLWHYNDSDRLSLSGIQMLLKTMHGDCHQGRGGSVEKTEV